MFIDDLKKSILQKAIQWKLVEQNPNNEPASELLKRIRDEKEKLIKDGKIKKEKSPSPITDEEKPFDIPSSWEWVRVRDVCYFWNGEKMSWKKYPYLEARYLRGKDAGKIYSEWNFVEKWNRLILVDWENSWELFDLNEDWYLWSTFKIFNTYKSINADYLQKFLAFRKDEFRNNKTWAAIPHLNKDLFFNYPLPLPPLEEQKRIVAKLDELMPLLDEARPLEEEITKLEKDFPSKLRQSILQYAIQWKLVEQNSGDEPASELLKKIKEEKEKLIKEWKIKKEKTLEPITDEEKPFEIPSNWEWVRLGEIVWYYWWYAYKSFKFVKSSPYQVLRLGNVKNNLIKLDASPVFIDDDYAKETVNYKCKKWDILITQTWTKNKRDYFYSVLVNSDVSYFINQRVWILRPYSNLGLWLNVALKANSTLNQVFEYETGTANQGNLWANDILKILIPLPPLEEQKRIVTKLDELVKLCDELEEQIG